MASIHEIVTGLEIMAKTAEIPKGLAEQGVTDRRSALLGGAEHDILYGVPCEPSAEDQQKLRDLGWHFEEETDSWAHFV